MVAEKEVHPPQNNDVTCMAYKLIGRPLSLIFLSMQLTPLEISRGYNIRKKGRQCGFN